MWTLACGWRLSRPIGTVQRPEVGAFKHPEYLNTPRLVADSAGTTVWKWDQQEPFGNDTPNGDPNSTGTAFDFPVRLSDYYADKETGNFYAQQRDAYNPAIGAFPQSDPIGLRGGVNTYQYVSANPLGLVDPFGLQAARCRRTIGSEPGGQLYGRATQHWYSCVYVEGGKWECGGQTSSVGFFGLLGSEGAPTTSRTDRYVESACPLLADSNKCFEGCLQKEWKRPRPYYSVLPFVGTQCQTYDQDVNTRCRAECGLK